MTNNRSDHSERLIPFFLSLMFTRPASIQKSLKSGWRKETNACELYSHGSFTHGPTTLGKRGFCSRARPLKRVMLPEMSYLAPVGSLPESPSEKSSVHCSLPVMPS